MPLVVCDVPIGRAERGCSVPSLLNMLDEVRVWVEKDDWVIRGVLKLVELRNGSCG